MWESIHAPPPKPPSPVSQRNGPPSHSTKGQNNQNAPRPSAFHSFSSDAARRDFPERSASKGAKPARQLDQDRKKEKAEKKRKTFELLCSMRREFERRGQLPGGSTRQRNPVREEKADDEDGNSDPHDDSHPRSPPGAPNHLKTPVCDHCALHGLDCEPGSVCWACYIFRQACVHRWCPRSPESIDDCPNPRCAYIHMDAVPPPMPKFVRHKPRWIILRGLLPSQRDLVGEALTMRRAFQGPVHATRRQRGALAMINRAARFGVGYPDMLFSCDCWPQGDGGWKAGSELAGERLQRPDEVGMVGEDEDGEDDDDDDSLDRIHGPRALASGWDVRVDRSKKEPRDAKGEEQKITHVGRRPENDGTAVHHPATLRYEPDSDEDEMREENEDDREVMEDLEPKHGRAIDLLEEFLLENKTKARRG